MKQTEAKAYNSWSLEATCDPTLGCWRCKTAKLVHAGGLSVECIQTSSWDTKYSAYKHEFKHQRWYCASWAPETVLKIKNNRKVWDMSKIQKRQRLITVLTQQTDCRFLHLTNAPFIYWSRLHPFYQLPWWNRDRTASYCRVFDPSLYILFLYLIYLEDRSLTFSFVENFMKLSKDMIITEGIS